MLTDHRVPGRCLVSASPAGTLYVPHDLASDMDTRDVMQIFMLAYLASPLLSV